jgi:chorismate mutase
VNATPDPPAAGAHVAEARLAEARLAELRATLDAVDAELVARVAERARLAAAAGEVKRALGRPLVDPAQEARVLDRAAERAAAAGLDPALARAAFQALVALARHAQGAPAAAPDPGGTPEPTGGGR